MPASGEFYDNGYQTSKHALQRRPPAEASQTWIARAIQQSISITRVLLDHPYIQTKGIGGAEPGAKPTYRVICDLVFDSVESFQHAYQRHVAAIAGDVVNYTTIEPIIQVCAVKL